MPRTEKNAAARDDLLSPTALHVSKPSKKDRTAARIKRMTTDRGIAREGWSVSEWCARMGISCNGFYRLSVSDRPATIKVGNRRIITRRADEAWQRLMAERDGSEQTTSARLPSDGAAS